MRVRMDGPGRARVVTRVIAVAAAAAVLVTSCRTGFSYEQQAKQAERTTPEQKPWFCNSVGQGTPPSGHGNGSHVHPIYEGRTKGPLTWEDCRKLASELDATLQAVKGFETRAKGEAAGWRESAAYIPGLGTHHSKASGGIGGPGGTVPSNAEVQRIVACLREKGVNLSGGVPDFTDPKVVDALRACGAGLPTGTPGTTPGTGTTSGSTPGSVPRVPGGLGGLGGAFDPAKPQILIYGGAGGDAPLVGVAYAFFGGSTPPEAYTGGNDWWHLHSKICMGPNREILAGAEEISDERCKALGGTNRNLSGLSGGGGIWLLHLWMVPGYEYRPDLFVSGHNCLLETGVAPQSHPCWSIARSDPSLGVPPPPPDPGDPGEHGAHGH